MNFKPADIYLSIVDFFAVFLPGALVVFGLACGTDTWITDHIFPNPILPNIKSLGPTGKMAAFVFSSYIVGSFVTIIGSLFEDMINYRCFYWITKLFIYDYSGVEKLREYAENLMNNNVKQHLSGYPKTDGDAPLIKKPFQWIKKMRRKSADRKGKVLYMRRLIKASLRVNSPAAMTELDHMEATSKFFRNFAIALAIFLLYIAKVIWDTGLNGGVIVLTALVLSSVCMYLIQDYQRDRYIYIYFLLQEKLKKPAGTVTADNKQSPLDVVVKFQASDIADGIL
jgi:hypothetical protein